MIGYGDKFILTKDYGGAKKNTVFEVDGFNIENGIVKMKNDFSFVCVDSDAMKALFVPFLGTSYNDSQPVKKKNGWSKWEGIDYYSDEVEIYGCNVIDCMLYEKYVVQDNAIKWRTNGKRTEVKIETKDGDFKSHACCNANDDFDIDKGVTIATYHALKKMIDNEIEKVIANA